MASAATAAVRSRSQAAPSPVSWFAACTAPRHEKRVLQSLTERHIEAFLPLYQSVRTWKDRKKVVDLPLFSGYIFVHIAAEDRLRVLQLPSVARFVCFDGRPAPLPDGQIEALRSGSQHGARFTPHPLLKAGARVRVRRGCFSGAEGILVRRRHVLRFVLSLDLLNRAISVEVDAADVEPLR